jgi:hypothetical protein
MKDCLPKEGHEDPGKEQLFLATLPGEQLLPWDVGLWQRKATKGLVQAQVT